MNYTASRRTVESMEVVFLEDAARGVEVWIAPPIGNIAYSMTVHGSRFYWSPYTTLTEMRQRPTLLGNPFLAPWANRIDSLSYYANGKKYVLNPELKNFRLDGNKQPIHGLVVYAPWEVISLASGEDHAEVRSRLDFWRHPDWMEQFPFAHAYEMTYRLANGELEVELSIENLSNEPMPLVLGFHPYYTLAGVERDSWKVNIPAKDHVVLSPTLVPTGERQPFTDSQPISLGGRQFDDVFTSLEPRPVFRVAGAGKSLEVRFGEKYTVGVVYAPRGRDFICFEPMTGITNGFNLAHEGKYPELQSIAGGGRWRESYWVRGTIG